MIFFFDDDGKTHTTGAMAAATLFLNGIRPVSFQ